MTAFDDRSWARYDDPTWRTAAGLPGLERAGRASQPLDAQAAPPAAGPYRPPSRQAVPHQAPDHPASNAQAPTRAGSDAERAARFAAAKATAGAGAAKGDRVARENRVRKHAFAAGLAVFAGCFGLVVQAGTPGSAADGGAVDDAAAAMTLETSTPAAAVIVLPSATPEPSATPVADVALGKTDAGTTNGFANTPTLGPATATPALQSPGASARQTVIAAATARAERVAGSSDGTVATVTTTAPRATATPRPVTVPATPTPRARTRSSR